jgi:membrane protein YdbS with pleckstrin-like domain
MGYLESLMGEKEKIALKERQHWLVIVPKLVLWGAVALLVLLVTAVLSVATPLDGVALVLLLALVVPFWRMMVDLLNWWNEQYVITNRRVIQLEGTINKHSIDSSLEKVNDVVLEQSAMGRMLNYGDVQILTASEMGVNLFRRIARPVRFKTEMLNQKEALGDLGAFEGRARRVLAEEAPSKGDIPELIAELDELRKRGIITDEEFQDKKKALLAKL